MKKAFIIIFCFINLSLFAKKNIIELFKEGNEKYKKGQYQDAIQYYETILSKNIKNGYIYYNLANSYFKLNQIGKSILNYERALIYLPSDSDIKFNLKFANSRKVDRIAEPIQNPFTKVILFLYNIFPINSLFTITYFLFIISIGSLVFKWFNKNINLQIINQKVFHYSGILFIIFLFVLIIKTHQIKSTEYAIILSQEIQIKSGPSDDYTDIFSLHEGAKVKIRKRNQDWILITMPNGYSGWTRKEHLESI